MTDLALDPTSGSPPGAGHRSPWDPPLRVARIDHPDSSAQLTSQDTHTLQFTDPKTVIFTDAPTGTSATAYDVPFAVGVRPGRSVLPHIQVRKNPTGYNMP